MYNIVKCNKKINKEARELMNKVVLVTGGSRGIGAGIVKELASEGYTVILNYNKSEEKAKAVQEELTKSGKKVEIYKAIN